MATRAQISASRRNGAKSKGPKTEEGRAVASRNALKHGLTAEQIMLIFGEAEDDFMRFHDEMRGALQPGDAVEEQLVERIVISAWRLRRAYRAEAGTMNHELEEVREWCEKNDIKGEPPPHPGIALSGAAWKLNVISRYEVTIERAMRQAMLMLERRQALRHGEAVPPPIALQIDGPEAEALIDRASIVAMTRLKRELALRNNDFDERFPSTEPSKHLPRETL
jgi:hypothetical protein